MRNFSNAQLTAHFGYDCDTVNGEITVWRDARPQPDWDALDAELTTIQRHAAIDARNQELKNASLGKTKEQIAETLKIQVNMGIGGLLLMLTRLQEATGDLLVSKGVCTPEEFSASLQSALGAEANATITARLTYWQWIVAMDTEAAALKADPARIENFPAPPPII